MPKTFPAWNYTFLAGGNCAPHGARALLNVTALGDAVTLLPKMFVAHSPEIFPPGHSKVTLTHHQPSAYS